MKHGGKKGGSSSTFKPLTLKDLNHPAPNEKIKYSPQIYEKMRKIIAASNALKEEKAARIEYTYTIQNLHKNFNFFVNNVLAIYNNRKDGTLPKSYLFNPKVNRDNWQQKAKRDSEGYELSDDGLRAYGSNAFMHHLNDIAMKSAPTVWNDLLSKFHNSFNYANENDKVDQWVNTGGWGCFEGVISDLSDWMSNDIHMKESLEGPLPEVSDAIEAARLGIQLYEKKFGPIPESDSAEDVLVKLKRVIKISVRDEEVLDQLAYIYERRDNEPEEAEIVALAPIPSPPTQPEKKSQKAQEKIYQAPKPVEPPKKTVEAPKPSQPAPSIPYVREMPPMGYMPETPSEKQVENFRLQIKKSLEKSQGSPRYKMNQLVYDLLNKYPPGQNDHLILTDQLREATQKAARAADPYFYFKPPNPASPEVQIEKFFNQAREMVQKHFINYEERQLKVLQDNLSAIHTLRDRIQTDIKVENSLQQEIEQLKREENQLENIQASVIEDLVPTAPPLIESEVPTLAPILRKPSENVLNKPGLAEKTPIQDQLILEIQGRINRERKVITEIAQTTKSVQPVKATPAKSSLDVTAEYNRRIERYEKQIKAANFEINNSINLILASKIPVHDQAALIEHEMSVKRKLDDELEKLKIHIKEIAVRNQKIQEVVSAPEIDVPKDMVGSFDYDLAAMELNPPEAPPLVEDLVSPQVSITQKQQKRPQKAIDMNFFDSQLAERVKLRRKALAEPEITIESEEENQQDKLMRFAIEMVRLAQDQGIQDWEKTAVQFTPLLKQRSEHLIVPPPIRTQGDDLVALDTPDISPTPSSGSRSDSIPESPVSRQDSPPPQEEWLEGQYEISEAQKPQSWTTTERFSVTQPKEGTWTTTERYSVSDPPKTGKWTTTETSTERYTITEPKTGKWTTTSEHGSAPELEPRPKAKAFDYNASWIMIQRAVNELEVSHFKGKSRLAANLLKQHVSARHRMHELAEIFDVIEQTFRNTALHRDLVNILSVISDQINQMRKEQPKPKPKGK